MRGNDFDGLDAAETLRSVRIERLAEGVAYVKGSSVYCENMVTRMLLHISALVLSVAVISMKTLRVSRLIFE